MENLSKQDFDEIFVKSPKTYKVFLAWLDNWKKETSWNCYFVNDFASIKFHDLPFDLQKGVLLRFLCETYPRSKHEYVNKSKLKKILQNSVWYIEKILK